MVDDFFEKYGLRETKIDFDLHLSKDDLEMASEIDEGIKYINIKGVQVEFGFEEDIDDKDFVIMNFGFAGVKLKKEEFEEALKRYHLRDMALEEIKKQMEVKQ